MRTMTPLSALAGIISMRATFIVVNALDEEQGKNPPRQNGIVEPGTVPDCTFFETVQRASEDCEYWETKWSISHAKFVKWNPTVNSDCSGIRKGNSYCVQVSSGKSLPDAVDARTAVAAAASTPREKVVPPTDVEKKPSPRPKLAFFHPEPPSTQGNKTQASVGRPWPVQPYLVQDCTTFYQAKPGDTCKGIVASHGNLSLVQFVWWNISVRPSCVGLKPGYFYCVGRAKKRSSPPAVARPVSTVSSDQVPSPVQRGMAKDCTKYHKVESRDTCAGISQAYGSFSLDDFHRWNPAVGSSCGSLLAQHFVCVGVGPAATGKGRDW